MTKLTYDPGVNPYDFKANRGAPLWPERILRRCAVELHGGSLDQGQWFIPDDNLLYSFCFTLNGSTLTHTLTIRITDVDPDPRYKPVTVDPVEIVGDATKTRDWWIEQVGRAAIRVQRVSADDDPYEYDGGCPDPKAVVLGAAGALLGLLHGCMLNLHREDVAADNAKHANLVSVAEALGLDPRHMTAQTIYATELVKHYRYTCRGPDCYIIPGTMDDAKFVVLDIKLNNKGWWSCTWGMGDGRTVGWESTLGLHQDIAKLREKMATTIRQQRGVFSTLFNEFGLTDDEDAP